MSAIGQKLPARDRAQMSRAIAQFLSEIGNPLKLGSGWPRQLRRSDFPLARGQAYKVVTPDTETFLRKAAFRLGSPSYFAKLGTDPRADGWEGYSSLFADFGERTFSAAARAGYNCLAFCTTRARDRSRLALLRRKFGGPDGRLVKVTDVEGLASALADSLACTNVSVRDIQYSDSNFIHVTSEEYRGLDDILLNGPPSYDLTPELIHKLNEIFTPMVYQDVLMGSLFTKPVIYAAEQERRLVFELAKDVSAPNYIDIISPKALAFLEFQ